MNDPEKRNEVRAIYKASRGGSGDFTRHNERLIYTQGVRMIAEKMGAFWLIELIASYNRPEEFQIWWLNVREDRSAFLTMKEDTDRPLMVRKSLSFTDFPPGNWRFYLENGTLMLPEER